VKIARVSRPIQARFIKPTANRTDIKAQQHATQNAPWWKPGRRPSMLDKIAQGAATVGQTAVFQGGHLVETRNDEDGGADPPGGLRAAGHQRLQAQPDGIGHPSGQHPDPEVAEEKGGSPEKMGAGMTETRLRLPLRRRRIEVV
jgi:hypothetical protein